MPHFRQANIARLAWQQNKAQESSARSIPVSACIYSCPHSHMLTIQHLKFRDIIEHIREDEGVRHTRAFVLFHMLP